MKDDDTPQDDDTSRIDWAARLVLILAPATIIAMALRPWATPPLAWGVATLLSMLAVYPIKPRPSFGLMKWIGLSLACSLIASLLSFVLPGNG